MGVGVLLGTPGGPRKSHGVPTLAPANSRQASAALASAVSGNLRVVDHGEGNLECSTLIPL